MEVSRCAGREFGSTYVALECTGFVDGEDEDDVLASFECFFEDATVLYLGCPDRLRNLATVGQGNRFGGLTS